MSITLYRGGNLVRTYSDSKHKLRHERVDYLVGRDLFEQDFQMGKRVRVGDLFLMMARDLDFWERLLGPSTRPLVEEGVTFNPRKTRAKTGVCLDWCGNIDEDGKLGLGSMMDVNAFRLKKDAKGRPVTDFYGIDMMSARELGHELLEVDADFAIIKLRAKGPSRRFCESSRTPTLFDVVRSLIDELSCYGPPEVRHGEAAEMDRRCKSAEEEPDSLSWEEATRRMDAWCTLDAARGRRAAPRELSRSLRLQRAALLAARDIQPGEADPFDVLVEAEVARLTEARERRAARKAERGKQVAP